MGAEMITQIIWEEFFRATDVRVIGAFIKDNSCV